MQEKMSQWPLRNSVLSVKFSGAKDIKRQRPNVEAMKKNGQK